METLLTILKIFGYFAIAVTAMIIFVIWLDKRIDNLDK